jgi:hypothetical protein
MPNRVPRSGCGDIHSALTKILELFECPVVQRNGKPATGRTLKQPMAGCARENVGRAEGSQIDIDFRTGDMLRKTPVRFFALMLVLTVALVTSCTNADQNPNSRAAIPPGSSAHPQTGEPAALDEAQQAVMNAREQRLHQNQPQ